MAAGPYSLLAGISNVALKLANLVHICDPSPEPVLKRVRFTQNGRLIRLVRKRIVLIGTRSGIALDDAVATYIT